ncbi:MAG TPA: hypothetical protein VIH10_19520, partial [Kribbella sp.]
MSDNWNQPPGSDPADDQPERPPERGAGEGQSARWWTGGTEAKREFQNPSPGDRPENNWFDGGWETNRREHPDEPATGRPMPDQTRPPQP